MRAGARMQEQVTSEQVHGDRSIGQSCQKCCSCCTQMWDLRNSVSPLKEFVGHGKVRPACIRLEMEGRATQIAHDFGACRGEACAML